MEEGVLLARLAKAEQRIAQLEYQVMLLKQQAGRAEADVNVIRNKGAG